VEFSGFSTRPANRIRPVFIRFDHRHGRGLCTELVGLDSSFLQGTPAAVMASAVAAPTGEHTKFSLPSRTSRYKSNPKASLALTAPATVDARFDVQGKIAPVTGAARGLGRGRAVALAQAGQGVALGL